MVFTSAYPNNTFSFCSTTDLPVADIPITLQLSGSNYDSYTFSPSNKIILHVVTNTPNTIPTLNMVLNNQQKTFLDVNFTNNVDGIIFYEMMMGQNMTPNSLQTLQVYVKAGTWVLSSNADFMNFIYTNDRDNRIYQFFQTASTSTLRIQNLIPESAYTLCAYIINVFGAAGNLNCINLNTMTWGTVLKARLTFTSELTAQQLNNVICFFTKAVGTNQLYLVDSEGNSCDNRAVSNIYYRYKGSSFIT